MQDRPSATKANKPLPVGTGAWSPEVGVHRVVWNMGNGLANAPLLASGTGSGLCRVPHRLNILTVVRCVYVLRFRLLTIVGCGSGLLSGYLAFTRSEELPTTHLRLLLLGVLRRGKYLRVAIVRLRLACSILPPF